MKDDHLKSSNTFCMFPWLHMNVTPKGNIYPCCSSDYVEPFANTKDSTLAQAFNNDKMRQLRLDMLSGKKNEACTFCYKHEESSPYSFRKYSIEKFAHKYDELVPYTNADGSLDKFTMAYYDVRFSNICNFKCRTCGSEFSSKWAQEHKAHDAPPPGFKVIQHADDTGSLLNQVLDQIPNIELAYFAGGEPLITDEHYVILDEMIRNGSCKDIVLRYNTNMSNFKYKNYDILDMWSNFKKVEVSASLDHYGKKTEYIRHGTEWMTVENNLRKIRDIDFIDYQFNCVLSNLNYVTLADFIWYMINNDLLRQHDYISIYHLLNPSFYSAQSLPQELKDVGTKQLNALVEKMKQMDFWSVQHIENAIKFTNSNDIWNDNKQEFIHNTVRRDKIRNENFVEIFPELTSMLNG
jgi:MoaA/NifB/PqqE/SkfB family radical SAM enzyme